MRASKSTSNRATGTFTTLPMHGRPVSVLSAERPSRRRGDGRDPDGAPTAAERLVNRLLDDAAAPVEGRPDVPAGFVTVCFDPTHPAQPRRTERAFREGIDASTDVFRPEQVDTRADRLLREGVDVERAVWDDIFEYSSDVLAPEFEGSYRGAGFEINE